MTPYPRQVSDALRTMQRIFSTRREFRAGELDALAKCCGILAENAVTLEDEVERLRFTEVRRREVATDALLAEVGRPDSNVRLFRIVPRHVAGRTL